LRKKSRKGENFNLFSSYYFQNPQFLETQAFSNKKCRPKTKGELIFTHCTVFPAEGKNIIKKSFFAAHIPFRAEFALDGVEIGCASCH